MERKPYDLQDRLIGFGVMVCTLCEEFPETRAGNHVAGQLIRSATSPFANYSEAQGGVSRKEFVYRLGVTRRELRESNSWLTFARRTGLASEEVLQPTLDECDELLAIMSTAIRTAQRNQR
jgi:four helix bundle protein